MPKALDVANHIISLAEQIGEPVTNMKLQKLLYYAYAWHLVEFEGTKLFDEPIQAWPYGPVIPAVYFRYNGYGADNIKEPIDGNSSAINQASKDLIDEVFNVYGGKSAIELMLLSHSEAPWRDIYADGQKNNIPDELMFEYFRQKKQSEA